MARPPKANRDEVNLGTFSMKVSPAFKALLEAVVRHREAVLEETTGQRVPLTSAALLRWLVEAYAKEEGIKGPGEAPPRRPR